MVFSCKPNFAAKKQALKQKLAGAGAYHGVSLRLLLVDKQVDAQDVLPNAALASVHVVKYDAKATALAELVGLVREAHRQNGAPFLSMAIAQHGADAEGQWEWTTDLSVNLKSMHGAIDQLAPVIEVLAAALSKTKAGKAHIDLLACNLATTCKGLIPALEKMYGIDFRASTDETGNDLSGGDWKMETDNDYDVAADYLDAAKLKAYNETMGKGEEGGIEMAPMGASRQPAAAAAAPAVIDRGMASALAAIDDDYFSQDMGTLIAPQARELSFLRKYETYALRRRGTILGAACTAKVGGKAVAKGTLAYSKRAIALDASVRVEFAAEATATIDRENSAGKFEAALTARMAAYAESYVKAEITRTGAKFGAGAKVGTGVSFVGEATWTSPGDIVTIEVVAGVAAGAVLQATVAASFGQTSPGKYEFEYTVGAGAAVAVEFTVKITLDLSGLVGKTEDAILEELRVWWAQRGGVPGEHEQGIEMVCMRR